MLKVDKTRSKTARFGDLTLAIQTSQVRRRVRTASPIQGDLTLDESVGGLNLNAAVGLTSYSNDELWQAHGPQTLQDACSFVRRVVESMSKNNTTTTNTVQQILRKDARKALQKRGIVEFAISDSETSNPEPQGEGDVRTKKRKHSSNNEEPKTKALSNQGGSAGSTGKKSLQTKSSGSQQDQPPPKDLEGAPTRGAGEITTLTRTTGREIDLLLGTSAAETVTSRATGMTVTVEVVVVNGSKYSIMLWVFNSPPLQFSSKSKNTHNWNNDKPYEC